MADGFEPSQTQQLAQGLQGFGAGLLGQGPQFQAQQAQNQRFQAAQQQQAQKAQQEQIKLRTEAAFQDAELALFHADKGDFSSVVQLGVSRLRDLKGFPDADPADTQRLTQLAVKANEGNEEAAGLLKDELKNRIKEGQVRGFIERPKEITDTAGEREFASLTEGLSEEQKTEATLIKLGLSPRAVGSAIQTIAAEDIAEEIGKASATIKEREKFGAMTGASRAKAIDKGFDRITKIDTGLRNIDRAVDAVRAGAGVGAIEKNFPSIRAASVELDNIQGLMALDVIGAVTFGALSKGELDLAKQIALPTGLNTEELIQHLTDKKAAQEKLRSYFSDQIQFLDQGGTVAGFLRDQERKLGDTGQAEQTDQQAVAQPQQEAGIKFLGFE